MYKEEMYFCFFPIWITNWSKSTNWIFHPFPTVSKCHLPSVFYFISLACFKGQQNFSVKNQRVDVLWFVSLRASITWLTSVVVVQKQLAGGAVPPIKLYLQNRRWAGLGTGAFIWSPLVYFSAVPPLEHCFNYVELWSFIFLFGRSVCPPYSTLKLSKLSLAL